MEIKAKYSYYNDFVYFQIIYDFNNLGKKVCIDITKPNTIIVIFDGRIIGKCSFADIEFNSDNLFDLKRSETNIDFYIKCCKSNNKNLFMKCNCQCMIENKLKNAFYLDCSFCSSSILNFESVNNIVLERCDNGQIHENFFCCNHSKKTLGSSKKKEFNDTTCINLGHEISPNKALLNPHCLDNKKNILFCKRCQFLIGRYDSMMDNRLNIFVTQVSVRLPNYDIDGDIVGQIVKPLIINNPIQLVHTMLTHMLANEVHKIQLIALSDNNDEELLDYALIKTDCDIWYHYSTSFDLEGTKNETISWDKRIINLKYLSRDSNELFHVELDKWEHDMSVFHMFCPLEVCKTFVNYISDNATLQLDNESFLISTIELKCD